MSPTLYWRQLRREARGSGGRLLFFVACLATGVAAVVAVAGLIDGIDGAVRGQARELLAADLVVAGRSAVPEGTRAAAAELPGAAVAEIRELVTVVVGEPRPTADRSREEVPGAPRPGAPQPGAPQPGAPGPSHLVELKAVRGGYPFYGQLTTEPADARDLEILGDDGALVAPDLLARFGLDVGDSLRIGGEHFTIVGTVLDEPDRIATALTRGPRVFVTLEGLARTSLEGRGSLVEHRLLVRLADDVEVAAAAASLRATIDPAVRLRVETYAEAQPTLRRGLARLERFLGLAALLSLLIGGVGTAQIVRAWLEGRLDAIAVLRCLGWRPREVLALYLGQTALLALAGGAVGVFAGIGLQQLAARVLADLLPIGRVAWWQPEAAARGLVLGLSVAVLFALPTLLSVRRVPPIRVLRRDAEPLPPSRRAQWLTRLVLLAGIGAIAAWQARSATLGLAFTVGVAVVTGLLALASRGLMRLGAAPQGRARPWIRHGLAALARPGAGTLGAVVAVGLGVAVLLGLRLVEDQLAAQLGRDLPRDAPSAFLVDIQPDQWTAVQALLEREEGDRIDSVPVVVARLSAVDGTEVDDLPAPGNAAPDAEELTEEEREKRRRNWAWTREQRLTYLETLPDDNVVVEGALWQRPDVDEISLETSFADALGARLGSRLRFDVQGVPVEVEVTSLRTVDWGTFGLNFFAVVEPGVLDDAPQTRVATVRIPAAAEQAAQDRLVTAFPNITMVRIRDVLEKVAAVVERLTRGIRLLGGLVLAAGLLILAGAIGASALRRGREVALYKTLGMTRAQVATAFAVEYVLIGLVAGLVGTVAGTALAWAVTTKGMEIAWHWPTSTVAAAPLVAALLTVVAGLAASASALRRRPIQVLRDVA